MPIKDSAAKALRQSKKARKRHKKRKAKVKFLRRNFLRSVEEGNKKEAKEIYPKLQKAIDKAAKTGAISKNAASRKKSTLAKKLDSLD